MSNFNKNGWVSLAQICEERQLVIDAETGKKVLRPAYFSSSSLLRGRSVMKALKS